MAKKRFNYDDEFNEDDELLLDRKAKRKRERELERQRRNEESNSAPAAPADNTMSQIVALCQENRWREAELCCLAAIEKYTAENNEDGINGIVMAMPKIDRSWRRQMVAAFVAGAAKMLNKE